MIIIIFRILFAMALVLILSLMIMSLLLDENLFKKYFRPILRCVLIFISLVLCFYAALAMLGIVS